MHVENQKLILQVLNLKRPLKLDLFFLFSKEGLMTSTTHVSPNPGDMPTGVQAHRSLPQVVPFWVISILVIVAAIAILVTIFFLYRWNSRYSGSFKPESASSSCGNSPKHGAQPIAKPRIYVSAHDEKA